MPSRRPAVPLAALAATFALPASAPAEVIEVPFAADSRLPAVVRDAVRDRLHAQTLKVARSAARLRGERLRAGYPAALRTLSTADLRDRRTALRRELRRLQRTGGAPAVPIPAVLASIAACESGGDPRAIGGGGLYRGKYQFSRETWAAVGGQGDPAAAPELEQDRRAAMLYARAGAGQWPVCGR